MKIQIAYDKEKHLFYSEILDNSKNKILRSDEIIEKLNFLYSLADVAQTLITYRDGTKHYEKAERKLQFILRRLEI